MITAGEMRAAGGDGIPPGLTGVPFAQTRFQTGPSIFAVDNLFDFAYKEDYGSPAAQRVVHAGASGHFWFSFTVA